MTTEWQKNSLATVRRLKSNLTDRGKCPGGGGCHRSHSHDTQCALAYMLHGFGYGRTNRTNNYRGTRDKGCLRRNLQPRIY